MVASTDADVKALLARAGDTLDWAANGRVIRLYGDFEERRAASTMDGKWELLIAPGGVSRLDVVAPEFRKTVWSKDALEWVDGKPVADDPIVSLQTILGIRDSLLAVYPQAEYREFQGKNKVPCVEMRATVQKQEKGWTVCIDASTGAPLEFHLDERTYHFGDYRAIGDRWLAGRVSITFENDTVFILTAASDAPTIATDSAQLSPPLNLEALAGRKCVADSFGAILKKKVLPDYPPTAKMARVQGTVEFAVEVGADGRVKKVTPLSGHPMLVEAARAAVSGWEYSPIVCDGMPVPMHTYITVNFGLSGPY